MKGSADLKVVKIVKGKKFKKSTKKIAKPPVDDGVETVDDDNADDDVVETKPKREVAVQPRRDFATDLLGYISMWNYRETSGQWKFNKILQTWALDNCFEKEKVDATLFKVLIPYLLSIKGSAVDRLLARAEEIITKSCDEEEDEDEADDAAGAEEKLKVNADNTESCKGASLKRAIKIKIEFSKIK